MCVVGATTAMRWTRPSDSIRCATCRPNVVLPAAGVAEARNAAWRWEKTASTALRCQLRSGRVDGQGGMRLFIGGRRVPTDTTEERRRNATTNLS